MNRIIFADKTFEGSVSGVTQYGGRECYRFILTAPYTDVAKYFVDGASYVWEYDTVITDDEGVETPSVVKKDLSALGFTIAGDIIDKRDGKISVYMGRKNKDEIIAEKDAKIATLEAEKAALKKETKA